MEDFLEGKLLNMEDENFDDEENETASFEDEDEKEEKDDEEDNEFYSPDGEF